MFFSLTTGAAREPVAEFRPDIASCLFAAGRRGSGAYEMASDCGGLVVSFTLRRRSAYVLAGATPAWADRLEEAITSGRPVVRKWPGEPVFTIAAAEWFAGAWARQRLMDSCGSGVAYREIVRSGRGGM